MMTRAEIHAIAEKWLHLFETNAVAQNDGYVQTLEADLQAAGFVMDQFASLTPDHTQLPDRNDEAATTAFIRAIIDSRALGNGIYSMWQQVTYWHQQSLADPSNRHWFLEAFAQLSALTEPVGELQSVTISSQRAFNFAYDPSVLVEQTLIFQASGAVTLRNRFASNFEDQQHAQLTTAQVQALFKLLRSVTTPVELHFENLRVLPGAWTVTFKGVGGSEQVTGNLEEFTELSDQIRRMLPFPQLLLFDNAPDRLERLIVELAPDDDTNEKLVIDRHSQTLSITSKQSDHKSRFAVANAEVRNLLAQLDDLDFSGSDTPSPVLPLALTARYRYAPPVAVYGTVTLDEQIGDWQYAAALIRQWLKSFYPQMIDQRLLSRNSPNPGDLLYAKVVFHHGERPYSYLATPEFAIGDRVVVPTTYATQYGTIVAMNYYAPSDAPYPPEKTKQILRFADPVEESQYDPDGYDF